MTLEELNNLSLPEATEVLLRCCGASYWAEQVAAKRPFAEEDSLYVAADKVWAACTKPQYLEAFSHHPKIGDVKSLEEKFNNTAVWATGEQKSVEKASGDVINKLAELNTAYELKFGFIFIVCATGKSAVEMLQLLEERIENNTEGELEIAAAEQHKITLIRLKKLLS